MWSQTYDPLHHLALWLVRIRPRWCRRRNGAGACYGLPSFGVLKRSFSFGCPNPILPQPARTWVGARLAGLVPPP